MQEFLNKLGITGNLITGDNGVKVLSIDNMDEYGKIFSKLDNSNLVEEDTESSQITEDTSALQYQNDEFIITLLADFENDNYLLTIKDR